MVNVAQVRSPIRILLVALALGWAADFLFYGRTLGVSVPLFVALILGALYALSRVEGVSTNRNLWMIAPLLFFAVMVVVRANPTLTWLNATAVVVLLTLLFFFYASDHLERLGVLGYPVVIMLALWNMLTGARPAIGSVAHDSAKHKQQMRMATPLLRGILLALPILALFTFLLASADSIFSSYVGKLFQQDFLSGMPERLWRQVIIIAISWIIAGGLLYALTRHRRLEEGKPRVNPFKARFFDRSLGFVEGATVLALVNMLFAFFAWVQFTNIFFGRPASMYFEEYREYVRHGFGELLLVAALTIMLIVGLRHLVWKETPRHIAAFNLLCTLMIGFGFVMLVSAFTRMLVWESVSFYINTPLRMYVRAFIIWLGATFLWLLFTSWLKPERFAIGAFGALLGFLVTINIMNPDADVATYNLARNDELSTRYLSLLSEDAIPAMAQGLNVTTGDVHDVLRTHLVERLAQMEFYSKQSEWPSFHLARYDAYRTLVGLRDTGRLDPPQVETGYPAWTGMSTHVAR